MKPILSAVKIRGLSIAIVLGASAVGAAGEPPALPPQLVAPAPPPATLHGVDLRTHDAAAQLAQAREVGQYADAATYQYWIVQRTKHGRYELASAYARANQPVAARYWLARAALDEGLDLERAQHDPELASLRADPSWNGMLLPFLQKCAQYWVASGLGRVALVEPHGGRAPRATLIYLHGMASRPDDWADAQKLADKLDVAIAGVSATLPGGPASFSWSEEGARDAQRVTAALAELPPRLRKRPLVLIGFAQGAQVALETAARAPERFAGAIALSPELRTRAGWTGMTASPALAPRGFVVAYGANELPATVRLAAADVGWLNAAHARVEDVAYPGVAEHALPADLAQRLPDWIAFLLRAQP